MQDRRKTLIIIVVVAIVALGLGVVGGTLIIKSPADAAAEREAPEAGPITVPVETRALESRIVTRGDAAFAGAVDVTLEVGGVEAPIVTGRVPERGDELAESDVILEITGRPVIALEGALPMYRTLRPGLSGPDVEQLEQTLERLGYDPGTVDENFTGATGNAIEALYDAVGYEPPAPDEQAEAELQAAQDAVNFADDEVQQAEDVLEAAAQGPSEAEILQAEQAVDDAEFALAAAKEEGNQQAIDQAETQLELAKLTLKDLKAGPDTSAEKEALADAKARLGEAITARDEAAVAAGTPLPVTEIVYIPTLPRRVDAVNVSIGDTVEAAVMSVSGADMVITATVTPAERELLAEDMVAQVELATGETADAVITEFGEAEEGDGEEGESGPGGDTIRLVPEDLSADQVDMLRETNVRIEIAVESTEGEVLAVPVAALTSGPGGESRVEVERDGEYVLQEVDVGLSAEGFAEVAAVDGELGEGDLVVVGQ